MDFGGYGAKRWEELHSEVTTAESGKREIATASHSSSGGAEAKGLGVE